MFGGRSDRLKDPCPSHSTDQDISVKRSGSRIRVLDDPAQQLCSLQQSIIEVDPGGPQLQPKGVEAGSWMHPLSVYCAADASKHAVGVTL